MTPATTVRIVDLVLELWNTGRPELAAAAYAPEGERVDAMNPVPLHGPEEIAAQVRKVRAAFGNFSLDVTESYADDDQLICFWTCSGIHEREFLGVLPTSRRVETSGVTMAQIRDERIVQDYTWFDVFALIEQLRSGMRLVQAEVETTM